MKYQARPMIGRRNKSWYIVNEFGGLIEEFDGTRKQAEARAAEVERVNEALSSPADRGDDPVPTDEQLRAELERVRSCIWHSQTELDPAAKRVLYANLRRLYRRSANDAEAKP
jgi:hypothetical protein